MRETLYDALLHQVLKYLEIKFFKFLIILVFEKAIFAKVGLCLTYIGSIYIVGYILFWLWNGWWFDK